jgi:hypothetical protein
MPWTRTKSYFEEGDLAVLDKAKNFGILALASNSTALPTALQQTLADLSYIRVWEGCH